MERQNLHKRPIERDGLVAQLKEKGVNPTIQRVEILRLLFERCEHLSADQVYSLLSDGTGDRVSKATVYNTLGLFARKGIVREVIADPTRIFYDPNTKPHHHIYNVSSGVLTDIDADSLSLSGLPGLPQGTQLEGIEVIVRVSDA